MRTKIISTKYTLCMDGSTGLSVLSEKRRGDVRILMLSDLHNDKKVNSSELFADMISDAAPDLIMCSGDMLTAKFGKVKMNHALHCMEELASVYPVYYVNGNHEQRMQQDPVVYTGAYGYYMDRLASLGVHCVNDRWEETTIHGCRLNIGGVCLPLTCYRRRNREHFSALDITKRIGHVPEEGYSILMAHHPDFFSSYVEWGCDLVFSGHLHGGLVGITAKHGLIGSRLELFPRYAKGIFRQNKTTMIVGAGLGDHTIPLRINNPRQIVIVDLIKGTS